MVGIKLKENKVVTKSDQKTYKTTSISMNWATWNDISARAWSPSALFQFGYECKKNAKSEGELQKELIALQKKFEFLYDKNKEMRIRLDLLEESDSEKAK